MATITAKEAGGTNVLAFLDMLAWSEGTDNGKQATKNRGYDVIVGGQLFGSYADHPRVLVDLPKLKIQSTAAGRYQLLRRYYDAYRKTLGLNDFSPLTQDKIALQQIRERRALPLIQGRPAPSEARSHERDDPIPARAVGAGGRRRCRRAALAEEAW